MTREYCKLKQEALDRNVRRTSFGRVYGPLVRQATEWIICLSVRWFTASVLRLSLFVRRGAIKHFIWLWTCI